MPYILLLFVYGAKIKETPAVLGQRFKICDKTMSMPFNQCLFLSAYSGDSRSPIPMISVHSVGDLLYRRQS
jgi:hypothetical protein